MTGVIRQEEPFFYLLPDLQSGQTLYIHVQGTSGNLDPIVALIDGTGDTKALQETHTTAIQRALVEGSAPCSPPTRHLTGSF